MGREQPHAARAVTGMLAAYAIADREAVPPTPAHRSCFQGAVRGTL